MYLAIVHIPHAVMSLAQFDANLGRSQLSHLVAAKRLLVVYSVIVGIPWSAFEFGFLMGDVVPTTVGAFLWNCAIFDAD